MLPEKQQFTGVNIGIYTDSEFSEIEILTQGENNIASPVGTAQTA